MRFTKYEQETIINFNAGEKDASIYTRDKAVMRQLDALVTAFPDMYRIDKVTEYDKCYLVDKKCITYRKPRRLTEEQRGKARERMMKINDRDSNCE